MKRYGKIKQVGKRKQGLKKSSVECKSDFWSEKITKLTRREQRVRRVRERGDNIFISSQSGAKREVIFSSTNGAIKRPISGFP